jgi:hypothetical protein
MLARITLSREAVWLMTTELPGARDSMRCGGLKGG